MATLAESFLADLDDLSDDGDVKHSDEEAGEQEAGEDAEASTRFGPPWRPPRAADQQPIAELLKLML
jgi:hypothetical protein